MEEGKKRVLVVGAGYAGVACAARLARKSRGTGTSVVLVDPRPYFVERIRLHEDVAGDVRARAPLARRLEGTGVSIVTGVVEGVDLRARRARVAGRDEPFDALVVATGSRGAPPAHALAVDTEEDALAARARLAAPDVRHVVVCGGGLTGVELAAELAEKRPELALSIVSAGEVLSTLGEGARAHARAFFGARGASVYEHARVAAVERDGVVLESGDSLRADAVVWACGLRASRFAADAGLAVAPDGRALVDGALRSVTHPFVRVAGDAASTGARMACAVALPTGCHAADALAAEVRGQAHAPFDFGFFVTCVSLGRRDGVIQKSHADDTPAARWRGGRPAAWFKEIVCRFALASTNEAWGIAYRWPHGQRRRDLRDRAPASLRHRVPDAR